MELLKKYFRNRTIGFYIGLAAAALALISGIIFLFVAQVGGLVFNVIAAKDKTFLVLIIVFMLVGAAAHALVIFTDFKFASIVPVVFYSVALGMHFYLTSFPLADLGTSIAFFGGSAPLAVSFGAIFLLCALASIVSCFMEQKKINI